MLKKLVSGTAALAIAVSAFAATAQADWRDDLPVFRIGLLGGENESDRLRNNECWRETLEEALGVPVEMYPAPDYAGVMQGLVAGQLEYAALGASAYAGIYLQDPEAVEPIFVSAEADGSLGYIAAMYTRADSDIESSKTWKATRWPGPIPTRPRAISCRASSFSRPASISTPISAAPASAAAMSRPSSPCSNGQYDAGVTWVPARASRRKATPAAICAAWSTTASST
jgi:phosphonate transport system substrate-binding protein